MRQASSLPVGWKPASLPSQSAVHRPATDRRVIDRVWNLLSSRTLALAVILALALASLAGVLLEQVNPDMASDPAAYAAWLLRVRPRYGAWTNVMSVFGLFQVFQTSWYRALLGLLSVQIVVCTANRWGALWRSTTHASFPRQERFYLHAPARAGVVAALQPGEAATALGRLLKRRFYRVKVRSDGDTHFVFADRNRFAKLGTVLSHSSLILILGGAIAGDVWGFRDRGFTVPEGSIRPVGFGTHLSVKLDEFVDEYYPDGPPKDYRSTLVLYEGDREVKRQVVRVNEPLLYGGVRFHQSFFGPAATLRVTDGDGQALFDDTIALAWNANGRPAGSFALPKQSLTVYAVGPASGGVDPLIGAGQLRLEGYLPGRSSPIFIENLSQGQPVTIQGLQYQFVREHQFTGLQVVKDPGGPVVWIAATLMILGLTMVFWFPHRRIWAMVRPAAGKPGSKKTMFGAGSEVLFASVPWTMESGIVRDETRNLASLALLLATARRGRGTGDWGQ